MALQPTQNRSSEELRTPNCVIYKQIHSSTRAISSVLAGGGILPRAMTHDGYRRGDGVQPMRPDRDTFLD